MFVGSEFRSCVNREVGLGGPGWASVGLRSHSLYLSSLVHIKTRLASWAPVPNCRSLRTYNSIKEVRQTYLPPLFQHVDNGVDFCLVFRWFFVFVFSEPQLYFKDVCSFLLSCSSSVLLYVYRDQGQTAQDGHFDFHTAPGLCFSIMRNHNNNDR